MAKLELVNGLPRMTAEASATTIYDKVIEIVASGATGDQLNGPITTGTNITLPASQTYTAGELEVRLNGDKLLVTYDYNYVGTAPRTQITMTFDLEVGDYLNLRLDRPA